MTKMKGKLFLVFVICLLVIQSCSYQYYKYHADWMIFDFKINGEDARDRISIYNFLINVKRGYATPAEIYRRNGSTTGYEDVEISLRHEHGEDYITFEDHSFFKGDFKIRCEDETCCYITLENDSIYLLMYYAGDIPFGRKRDCPLKWPGDEG